MVEGEEGHLEQLWQVLVSSNVTHAGPFPYCNGQKGDRFLSLHPPQFASDTYSRRGAPCWETIRLYSCSSVCQFEGTRPAGPGTGTG
jgi:hypothetical protein